VANLEFSNICYSGHVTRGSASSHQISHYSDKQSPKNDFIYIMASIRHLGFGKL